MNHVSRVPPMLEFELIASCDSKYRGASTSEGVGLRGDSNSPSRARDRSHDRGSAESRRRAYNDDDDGACIIGGTALNVDCWLVSSEAGAYRH